MRNALAQAPKTVSEMVAATIRTVFAQPDATGARGRCRQVANNLRSRLPRLAELLDESEDDVLAYVTFPNEH